MDEIQEIKNSINLRQYVQSICDLGKETKTTSGYLYKYCPMCNSRSDSGKRDSKGKKKIDNGHFLINDSTNSYSSFTKCCKGGSVIDFVMEYYNLDTKEAIEKCKEIAGIRRNGDMNKMYENNKKINTNSITNTNTSSTQNSTQISTQSEEEAKKDEYIKAQKVQFILNGIKEQTEEQKQKVYDYLESRNLDKSLVEKYNIFYSDNVYEDKTQGIEGTPRMVIPVYLNGQPFSYVARALINDVDAGMKVVNSARTGQVPLNIEYLKEEAEEKKTIYICEGWADAFSIEATGNKAIALHSTNNAKKLLKYITDNMQTASKYIYVLCCDNDEAGTRANEEMKKYFAENKIKYAVLNIDSKYHDINEWYVAVKDAEVFKNKINPFYSQTNMDYIDNSFLNDIKKLQEYKSKTTGFKNLDRELNGIYPRTIHHRCNKQFRKNNTYTSNYRPNGRCRRAYYIFQFRTKQV